MNPSLLQKQNERVSARELVNKQECEAYMEKVKEKIEAPSLLVTASQFSKRYARFVTDAAFTAMTVDNKGLDVSLDNSILQTDWTAEKWTPSFQFLEDAANEADRDAIIRQVFAGHLTPLWHTLALATDVAVPLLWENTAVRIFSLYEKKLSKNASAKEQQQIEDDLHYLVYEAPGELFGERINPLRPFYTPKTENAAGKSIRVRQTCCFVYETGGGRSCCSVCPKA
ncbi:siderophore-iron reductase, Fe-S cluster protein [Salibacterium salarium]|uniref:Siderophore-iron reductase, Fe-S cluster protein n=1 Tax=Salibacterium salarium TaxID=284579 RepID=A0A3R9R9N6_9BACI|nr:IucA/IucC family C-terminal-domain containing protein [Salibacterium salarium]RSL30387.1 siderophore-iron reductase, Fe-S cluster protein [Salibacterium salarium]